MNTITIVFTKNKYSFFSWLVRWAIPRSRFSLALSSHCLIMDDDNTHCYDTMPHSGVRYSKLEDVMDGATVVRILTYKVTDSKAGFDFLTQQLGKPYDLKGAIGLGLNPYREWDDEKSWFCFELAAATLKEAGLDIFVDINHITEIPLMSLKSM
jgi:uncharacterized protein YycO